MRSLPACALLLLAGACARMAEYGDPRLRPTPSPTSEASVTGEDVVRAKGTVRRLDEDGGFWGIRADDGRRYRVVDLPPVYRKDGTRIRFEGRARPGAGPSPWQTELELTDVSGV